MRRFAFRTILVAAAMSLAQGAHPVMAAMQLVPGGYGADLGSFTPPADLVMDSRRFGSSAAAAGLTLDFTPRASGSLFNAPALERTAPAMSLQLGVQERYGDRLRLDTIGLAGGFDDGLPSRAVTDANGLALGGAFNIDDWQVSGSIGRAALLGSEADLFAAGVGYGPVNARLVYGHVPRNSGTAGDLVMLSTDLAAWSWLTLEGDVAVSDTLVDEPLTVGRIGVRLNF